MFSCSHVPSPDARAPLTTAPIKVVENRCVSSSYTGDLFDLRLKGRIEDRQVCFDAVKVELDKCAMLRSRRLRVTINSSGGTASHAFQIYNAIRAFSGAVMTVADRCCYSAALVIFMGGGFRRATADTNFMIHRSSFDRDAIKGERFTTVDLRNLADQLADTDNRIIELLSARTDMARERFVSEIETENLLSDVDALELGVVHDIAGAAINPYWPAIAASSEIGRFYCVPNRCLTTSYLEACRVAAFFAQEEA